MTGFICLIQIHITISVWYLTYVLRDSDANITLVYCCFNNELICSKMSMKNGTETGEYGEGMWDKTDLWILEEAISIYSGKVNISTYLCSGKDRALSIQKAE